MARSRLRSILARLTGGGRPDLSSSPEPNSSPERGPVGPPATLALHRRPAWTPRTVEGEGRADGSRFGGAPWLKGDEEWPRCPNCGHRLQLFLQLDPADAPQAARANLGEGLLQLFYCTNGEPLCDVDCEAWAPGAASVLARRVHLGPSTGAVPADRPAGAHAPRAIHGWEEVDDYPNWAECEELGIEVTSEVEDFFEETGGPHQGDKLLGWPYWVQGVEYPDCPDCGRRMALLFQIDSEDNVPHMLGDMGVGHLTQCEDHRDRLAFGWACS